LSVATLMSESLADAGQRLQGLAESPLEARG
jgi:hypothetical protein